MKVPIRQCCGSFVWLFFHGLLSQFHTSFSQLVGRLFIAAELLVSGCKRALDYWDIKRANSEGVLAGRLVTTFYVPEKIDSVLCKLHRRYLFSAGQFAHNENPRFRKYD